MVPNEPEIDMLETFLEVNAGSKLLIMVSGRMGIIDGSKPDDVLSLPPFVRLEFHTCATERHMCFPPPQVGPKTDTTNPATQLTLTFLVECRD